MHQLGWDSAQLLHHHWIHSWFNRDEHERRFMHHKREDCTDLKCPSLCLPSISWARLTGCRVLLSLSQKRRLGDSIFCSYSVPFDVKHLWSLGKHRYVPLIQTDSASIWQTEVRYVCTKTEKEDKSDTLLNKKDKIKLKYKAYRETVMYSTPLKQSQHMRGKNMAEIEKLMYSLCTCAYTVCSQSEKGKKRNDVGSKKKQRDYRRRECRLWCLGATYPYQHGFLLCYLRINHCLTLSLCHFLSL